MKKHGNSPTKIRFLFQWSVFQAARQPIKSLLRIMYCTVMLVAVCQFCLTESLYRQMREELTITGYFYQCINAREIMSLRGGLAEEVYYEHKVSVNVGYVSHGISFDVILTNAPLQYLQGATDIQMADGYESSDFSRLGNNYLLAGDGFLTMTGTSLGEEINLYPAGTIDRILLTMQEKHAKEHEEEQKREDEILLLYLDQIREAMDFYRVTATIIGCFHTESQTMNSLAFTPGMGESTMANASFLGPNVIVDQARVLTDYKHAEGLREYGERLSEGKYQSFVLDTAGLDNLTSSIETMDAYYPWLFLILLLISLAIFLFSNRQERYSISLLRILGLPQFGVVEITVCENLIIIALGVIIGGIVCFVWNRALNRDVITKLFFTGGMELLTGIVSAGLNMILMSGHSPLYLLQTKE